MSSADPIEDSLVPFLQQLGLSEQKVKETLKSGPLTKTLSNIHGMIRNTSTIDPNVGTLLYHFGSKCKPQIARHMECLVQHIVAKQLNNTLRVDKALEYALNHINDFDEDELRKYCGVGVVVTPEQIEQVVEAAIKTHRTELLEKRYSFSVGPMMQSIRDQLTWADGKVVKNEVDLQILHLLGPKTQDDMEAPKKVQKNKRKNNTGDLTKEMSFPMKEAKKRQHAVETLNILDVMKKLNFHQPGHNYQTDGYVVTEYTHKLLEEHLKRTNGRVVTRFPPEPNGILHIGHAKAININFGYAMAHGGLCYLRYDDTNPEKEEEEFFKGIKEMVLWLGYKPYKITHSSDYFAQLYTWAVQLIKSGLAYVCHQKADEIKGFNPVPSPWRDRPIDENLKLFEDMKNGIFEEGEATLRMKLTLEEGKLDPIAYRVRYYPHHRTGTKWCIYPTYEYTHCLCDSIEDITHSLCTKEFQSRRSSYYWLCNALQIYCPVQWEYGRLNINYTVVSKRKILKLIQAGIVKDWDDPRLYTLTALRRRGFPVDAIKNFCAQLGVTGAQTTVNPDMLDAYVRDVLNATAPRRMVVLEPLKVIIENFPFAEPTQIRVPDFPNDGDNSSHTLTTFDRHIYIERTDFVDAADKNYYRLTMDQCVGLRHAGFIIMAREVVKDHQGNVVEVHAECIAANAEAAPKPKSFIHWVSQPAEIEVRLYSTLFMHKNPEDPAEVPNGFMSDCSPNSLKLVTSYTDKSWLTNVKPYQQYQFERAGFFAVDPDTTSEKIVFNKTVALKESTSGA